MLRWPDYFADPPSDTTSGDVNDAWFEVVQLEKHNSDCPLKSSESEEFDVSSDPVDRIDYDEDLATMARCRKVHGRELNARKDMHEFVTVPFSLKPDGRISPKGAAGNFLPGYRRPPPSQIGFVAKDQTNRTGLQLVSFCGGGASERMSDLTNEISPER